MCRTRFREYEKSYLLHKEHSTYNRFNVKSIDTELVTFVAH